MEIEEFKVKLCVNGWIVEYHDKAANKFRYEVFTDGAKLTERLNVFVWELQPPK